MLILLRGEYYSVPGDVKAENDGGVRDAPSWHSILLASFMIGSRRWFKLESASEAETYKQVPIQDIISATKRLMHVSCNS